MTYADVKMILELDNKSGPDVYMMAFFDYNLELHHKDKGVLPNPIEVLTSESNVLKKADYAAYKLNLDEGDEKDKKELICMNSKFRYNPIVGSSESIELVRLLMESKVDTIWKTNIKHVIEEKWRIVRWFIVFHALLHLSYLVLISIYVTLFFDNFLLALVAFVLSACMYIFELFQLYAERLNYLDDFWNYLDFFGTLLFMLHIILQ